jgi:hypothetical protein
MSAQPPEERIWRPVPSDFFLLVVRLAGWKARFMADCGLSGTFRVVPAGYFHCSHREF